MVPVSIQGDWTTQPSDPGVNRVVLTLMAHNYVLLTLGRSTGDVVVNADEIDFFNATPCDIPLPGGVGRYRWTLSGVSLRLAPLNDDPCPRSDDLANKTFAKVS